MNVCAVPSAGFGVTVSGVRPRLAAPTTSGQLPSAFVILYTATIKPAYRQPSGPSRLTVAYALLTSMETGEIGVVVASKIFMPAGSPPFAAPVLAISVCASPLACVPSASISSAGPVMPVSRVNWPGVGAVVPVTFARPVPV